MDDASTLDAVLRFLEEQDDVTEVAPVASESSLPIDVDCDTSWLDLGAESVEEVERNGNNKPKRTKPKPKRSAHYNSNKTREERRRELVSLRKHTQELEAQLKTLQQRQSAIVSSSGDVHGLNVWREIATQQRLQRQRVEEENAELKAALLGLVPVRESFQKVFQKRAVTEGMRLCGMDVARPANALPSAAMRDFGPDVLRELLDQIQSSGQDIDAICERIGIGFTESSYGDARVRENDSGSVVVEIFQNKVLPFTAQAAGELVWKNFSKIMSQVPFRRFYQRELKDAGVADDIVVESLAMETRLNSTVVDSHGLQVLRRHVEEDRSAVLWNSIHEPVRLSDQPLTGKTYRERGFMLIRTPKTLDPTQFCILTTCYIITPEATSTDESARNFYEFLKMDVAAGAAMNHQQIENLLLRDSLGQPL
ncbi:hypothetical protein Poli38472_000509 [Pythium oligandrum]|uniref:M96 mating-specific protein family n=1 Tax=Pythium oligandrum TaxID=41045 RepID=A0A8K1FI63_PYTOL|nr:hypothetical protein Poli38472_000509 [Pythium oligandrum]|eukprot:TMW60467.1 hypothetical protein Poli38472_000509 [Pythium oligandrum]